MAARDAVAVVAKGPLTCASVLTCRLVEMCHFARIKQGQLHQPARLELVSRCLAPSLTLARYPTQRIREQITVRACCESRQKAVQRTSLRHYIS